MKPTPSTPASMTRRRFVAATSATAAAVTLAPRAATAAAAPFAAQNGNTIPPPVVITGGVKPLFLPATVRPLRYSPEGLDFVIHNGAELFNRPIYGPISDFRIDAGDRPEFSFYLPGHGGNLKLGITTPRGAKWLADFSSVTARFRPGRMIYDLADPILGPSGTLRLELLTAAEGQGLLLEISASNAPANSALHFAFAGASGRKGRRNGDIGCEVEPVSQFFAVRAEECDGNAYTLDPAASTATLKSPACDLTFTFPPLTTLAIRDFAAWSSTPTSATAPPAPTHPILTAQTPLTTAPVHLAINRIFAPAHSSSIETPAAQFAARSTQVAAISATLSLSTPDSFIDPLGPALSNIADALWDEKQSCVMHGCVAWRVALAGWRGPYVLDCTGAHARAKTHFRHWLARQNTSPITTPGGPKGPATGPADPDMLLARKEALLHSNGDISNNHYDMNMVFFDVLLRHLRWTGDLTFAREIWPALERHLAWEHRLFRRVYTSAATGKALPLYEAYAVIWASDNLQYNGGGAAHSSAYNVFAFRMAAEIATLLGEDPTPYAAEAALIHEAMNELLWLPEQGAFAESKDLLGPQTVYTNPALWTVYHTIDSEVPTPQQARQMCAERLGALAPVPVHGPGVPPNLYMFSCSDWLPYMWSLNLLLLAENMHFALALWQAGQPEDAFPIFKGALLDSMYMGLCPGDFHMTSALDAHRQEAQRDFGDPTGCTARALVEGLFGVRPNLLRSEVHLHPGFPAHGDQAWDHATLRHPDFTFTFRRVSAAGTLTETYDFSSAFPRPVALIFHLPARASALPEVTSDGAAQEVTFAPDQRTAIIRVAPGTSFSLKVRWPDPIIGQPTPQLVASKSSYTTFLPIPPLAPHTHPDPLDLTPHLTHQLPTIFTRGYRTPRSPYTSLSVPETLLGGWANINKGEPVDDAGLRAANGTLQTPLNIPFRTPTGTAPNARFLSFFTHENGEPDDQSLKLALTGRATGIYLLLTGTTLPQTSRMEHATATVTYTSGAPATLSLRNPETWWPIEQDYLLDDLLFVNTAPLPPRVSLRTGETRLLTYATFKGKGRTIPGGAATILHLTLDPQRELATLTLEVKLWGIVAALLAATLTRPV